jgi:molybdopterin synthase sulfur carrier subunit
MTALGTGPIVKLLYFAWVRQKIGVTEEEFAAPPGVQTVSQLIDALRARGPGYDAAFRDSARLRCAVNQRHASFETALNAGDEVAFFPPVTGG